MFKAQNYGDLLREKQLRDEITFGDKGDKTGGLNLWSHTCQERALPLGYSQPSNLLGRKERFWIDSLDELFQGECRQRASVTYVRFQQVTDHPPKDTLKPRPQGLLPLPALVSHSTLPSVLANITLFIIPSKPVSNSNCLSQQPPSSQRDLSPSRFPLWYRNVSFPASYPRDRA